MPSDIFVRPARQADAPSLAALAIQVWLDTYAHEGVHDAMARYVLAEFTPAVFEARLADPKQRILVAASGSNLIGFAVLVEPATCPTPGGPDAELETLYIQRHSGGQGIGSRLFEAAKATASTGAFWLTVNAHNARALAFYAKQGCVRLGDTYFALDGARHLNHVLVTPALAST